MAIKQFSKVIHGQYSVDKDKTMRFQNDHRLALCPVKNRTLKIMEPVQILNHTIIVKRIEPRGVFFSSSQVNDTSDAFGPVSWDYVRQHDGSHINREAIEHCWI